MLVNLTFEDYLTYTCYTNLVAAVIRQQKFLLTWGELPALALSHHVKRELLTPVVFAVNRYYVSWKIKI